MTTTPTEAKPSVQGLPRSDSNEAARLIEVVLAERHHPVSPLAAARVGYEACYRAVESLEASRIAPEGLLRVLDCYGIRHGEPFSDPAKPYCIHVSIHGHGQTNCCGATVREAAQSALDWLIEREVSTQPAVPAQADMTDAEISRLMSASLPSFHEKGLFEYTRAAIRTYLEGK